MERLAAGEPAVPAPDPVTFVIFGGGGDLAHRKLLPALYNLQVDGLLPPRVAIIGCGRGEMDDAAYRAFAKDGIERFSRRPLDPHAWETFAQTLYFVSVSLGEEHGLASLGARLDIIEHERGLPGNRVYYLAIPPTLFGPTVKELERARFVNRSADHPFARVIVEKPIGRDLDSAQVINDAIAEVFQERQIYRIDHYLGKETVQNILVLRFANMIFEPLFNHRHVDHVQITVAEEEGVGTRAGYYDQAGALRDMVQNHLLQLLALVAHGVAAGAGRGRHSRQEARSAAVASPDHGRRGRHRRSCARNTPPASTSANPFRAISTRRTSRRTRARKRSSP